MTDLTMSQFASKDDLLAAQAARIAELESQLEAIGAGGVEPLRKQAAPQAAPQAVQAAAPVDKSPEMQDSAVDKSPVLQDSPVSPAHPAEAVPAQAVTKVQQTAPKVIYLNIGPDAEDYDFKDLCGVTWCDHDATYGSIQYVRADLAATQPAAQGMEADLTDEQIDEAFNQMPDGAAGFLKSWGYRQFARAVLAAQAKQGGEA